MIEWALGAPADAIEPLGDETNTNRSYRVEVDGHSSLVKFHGRGFDAARNLVANSEIAATLVDTPRCVLPPREHGGHIVSVWQWRSGRPLEPALDGAALAGIVEVLSALGGHGFDRAGPLVDGSVDPRFSGSPADAWASALRWHLDEARVARALGRELRVRVAAWSEEAAASLAALGPAVLSHGDLKPNNVLVRADGRVVVLDWEFARADTKWRDVADFSRALGRNSDAGRTFVADVLSTFPVVELDVQRVFGAYDVGWSLGQLRNARDDTASALVDVVRLAIAS